MLRSPLNGPKLRASSPPAGFSIFMTSAPRSARSAVQNGPARTRVRSTIFTPWSGPRFADAMIYAFKKIVGARLVPSHQDIRNAKRSDRISLLSRHVRALILCLLPRVSGEFMDRSISSGRRGQIGQHAKRFGLVGPGSYARDAGPLPGFEL